MAEIKYLDYNGLQKVSQVLSEKYLAIDGSVTIDGIPFKGNSINHFAYCNSSARATDKLVTLDSAIPDRLTNGLRLSIIFINGNSVVNNTITLTIQGLGSVAVYKSNTNIGLKQLPTYSIMDFIYYSGVWYAIDDNPSIIFGNSTTPITISSTPPTNQAVFGPFVSLCKTQNNPIGIWLDYNGTTILCWLNSWAKHPLGVMVPCFTIPAGSTFKTFTLVGTIASPYIIQFTPTA